MPDTTPAPAGQEPTAPPAAAQAAAPEALLSAAPPGEPKDPPPADPTPGEPGKPETDPAKPADPAAAPLSYDKLELPPGVDRSTLEPFLPIFEQAGMPAEAAQGLVTTFYEQQAIAERAQVDAWRAETLADPELGKPETLAAAARAYRAIVTPDAHAVLEQTGLGNHPAFVATFARLASLLSEDRLERGKDSPRPVSELDAWKTFFAEPEKGNET